MNDAMITDDLKSYLESIESNLEKKKMFEFYYLNGLTDFSYKVEIKIKLGMVSNTYFPRGHPGTQDVKKEGVIVKKLELTDQQLVSFTKGLIDCEAWRLENCKETGVPDEGSVKLCLKDGENVLFSKIVWEKCFKTDSRAKKIHELMEPIVPEGKAQF